LIENTFDIGHDARRNDEIQQVALVVRPKVNFNADQAW
jgi:hypothetical protein